MCTKLMYNIIKFKNIFQYQIAKFNNAKVQLLLHKFNRIFKGTPQKFLTTLYLLDHL